MVPFGEWKLAAGGQKSGFGYISQRPRISFVNKWPAVCLLLIHAEMGR